MYVLVCSSLCVLTFFVPLFLFYFHLKFVLSYVFGDKHGLRIEHAILVEEDMVVSPDFLLLFEKVKTKKLPHKRTVPYVSDMTNMYVSSFF